jgi:hypothetical protein
MLPHFQAGQPLKASDLEALVRHIRDTEIVSVIGGRLSRVSGGQSIVIDPPPIGGGKSAVCPFEVTTANEGNNWQFKVEWGLIGGKIPTGMFPGGDPALIMTWEDGWVLAYVTFVTDRVTVDTVNIVVNADIPENTVDGAYYPLAYLSTDSTNPENPVQVIKNMCTQPVPSVCDLVFTPPS